MSRYIDADKTVESLRLLYRDLPNISTVVSHYNHGVADAIVTINAQPTADVVSCADCIHGTKDFDKFLCEWNQEYHNGDWFCADGERREDDKKRSN